MTFAPRKATVAVHLAAIVALVLAASAAATPGLAAGNGSERVAVIGVFHDAVNNPRAESRDIERRHNGSLTFVYERSLKGFAGEFPRDSIQGIQRDRRVDYVEMDKPVHATIALPTGIDRVDADANSAIGIDGTDDHRVDADVAVLDTGIDLDHPDLNVVDGVNCLDHSGGPPWSRTYTCEAGGDDGHGHGTHVAGTIAALDDGVNVDGVDVVGVAPGARLYAVKVLDDNGSGSTGSVIAGIDWVTAHGGIEVANMSLGGSGESQAMDDALEASYLEGVAYAVAAGNSSADVDDYHPAGSPWVLTVSALADFDGKTGGEGSPTCRDDEDDTFADFSNYGDALGQDVDIIAPGVCILSTYPGGGYQDGWSGTSMASPHAAGAAALLASGDSTVEEIVGIVDADTLVDGDGLIETNGDDDWDAGDDPDGTKEPLVDVGDATVYDPVLVAGDDAPTDSPPSVSVTHPEDGATVSGAVTVTADASDDGTVQQVEFFVDAGSIGVDEDGSDGWSADWDTTTYDDGSHTVTAEATDDADQTASDSVGVTVDNTTKTVHVGDLDGASTNNGPNWTAHVTVLVHDASHNAVEGADVTLSYESERGGITGDATCTTGGDGTCTVSVSGIPKRDGSVTFSVTGVTADSATYEPGDNHDPDGDSDGTTITVTKP